jgi:diketogulonate reductase-like aldo/keto reductase
MVKEKEQPAATLNNGSVMPLLGLGVYDMYGKETEEAVTAALEIGYRLIDTASMYGNEKEVGNAVRSSAVPRDQIFITTKVNNNQQGYDTTLRAFDESLHKLNVGYIDLYLIHWPIKGKRKDTWKALEKLYKEGQVKAIGVANYLLPFLKELESYATVVPAVNQIEFSPFLFLKDVFDYCKQHHIQLQSYSPLTRGQKFKNPTLVAVAEKHGKSSAQVLIRWNLEHGISTIPKSSSRKRLQENFDVFDFALDEADLKLLDNLNENFRVVNDPIHML